MENVKVKIIKTNETGTIQATTKPLSENCNYLVEIDGLKENCTKWFYGKELELINQDKK
jgi:hypothetical protein